MSLRSAMPVSVLIALVGVSALATTSASARPAEPVRAAQDADDAPVLPSRLAIAIKRAQNSLDNATDHLDDGEYRASVISLRSVRRNMYRADKSARRVMNTVVDPEAEAPDGVATGPDAVIATLGLDQGIVTQSASLFDTNSKGVVDALSATMFRTLNARDRLLDAVIALDPEGAGADYADGMADTVAGYDDEVANLNEALQDDSLSTGGRKVLQKALAQSQATQAKITLAFGGGE